MEGKGKLTVTGKLGDVMQESAQAAFSYIRSRALTLGLTRDFYRNLDVHLHIPEGAIPKDGPVRRHHDRHHDLQRSDQDSGARRSRDDR